MDKVWKRENSAAQNKVWAFFQYLSNDFLKETFPLSFLNTKRQEQFSCCNNLDE